MDLFGRRKIYTSADDITADNLIRELGEAMIKHSQNVVQEDYLFWYKRGLQPILNRTKEIRPEICNKVVVNFAKQAVTFRNGYFLTKPVFYTGRNDADVNKIKELNNYLYNSGKSVADNKVVDWFHTVGVGAIIVRPSKSGDKVTPFKVNALDPRSAFVVYSLKPGNKPIMGVNLVMVDKNKAVFDVYTKDKFYRVNGGYARPNFEPKVLMPYEIVEEQANMIGRIPIIEYYSSEDRMACFEASIPLCNEYNNIESNRADGIEQTIQNLMVAVNVDFEEGTTANTIRQNGMICIRSTGENKAEIQLLSETLDQTATQVTLDSLKDQIHAMCGLPQSLASGRGSFENVGSAYLDRGYALTDTIDRNTEDCYRESNKLFTKVVLSILKSAIGFEIDINDLDIQFSKPELDNLLVRSQGALNLKQLGMSPELVFSKSGLSNDPISDVEASKDYLKVAFPTEMETEVTAPNDTPQEMADERKEEPIAKSENKGEYQGGEAEGVASVD